MEDISYSDFVSHNGQRMSGRHTRGEAACGGPLDSPG
jgi:hypothetical protein